MAETTSKLSIDKILSMVFKCSKLQDFIAPADLTAEHIRLYSLGKNMINEDDDAKQMLIGTEEMTGSGPSFDTDFGDLRTDMQDLFFKFWLGYLSNHLDNEDVMRNLMILFSLP